MRLSTLLIFLTISCGTAPKTTTDPSKNTKSSDDAKAAATCTMVVTGEVARTVTCEAVSSTIVQVGATATEGNFGANGTFQAPAGITTGNYSDMDDMKTVFFTMYNGDASYTGRPVTGHVDAFVAGGTFNKAAGTIEGSYINNATGQNAGTMKITFQ